MIKKVNKLIRKNKTSKKSFRKKRTKKSRKTRRKTKSRTKKLKKTGGNNRVKKCCGFKESQNNNSSSSPSPSRQSNNSSQVVQDKRIRVSFSAPPQNLSPAHIPSENIIEHETRNAAQHYRNSEKNEKDYSFCKCLDKNQLESKAPKGHCYVSEIRENYESVKNRCPKFELIKPTWLFGKTGTRHIRKCNRQFDSEILGENYSEICNDVPILI